MSLIAAFSACAVTPAAFSASFAPDLVTASAVSSRSTVTKLSPACWASFSASASTFAVWVSMTSSPPSTCGTLASARVERRPRLRRVAAGARDQVGGQPLVVVEQRLQQMLGQEPLVVLAQRDASAPAWTKPRARSENFSKFIALSLSAPFARCPSLRRIPRKALAQGR